MPQPIDFQTEVAKFSAAERVQQMLDRASLVAQQRMSQAEEQARLQAETQVGQTAQTQNPEVDGKGRRQNAFSKRRRYDAQAVTEENREAARHHGPLDAASGNCLDVDV